MGEVVLIHGAWHGTWCWDGVVRELTDRGVSATAVELPFTGFDGDWQAARRAIESAGEGALVCAHSYGGVVVDRALVGLETIRAVVYLAAFINDGGGSLGEEDIPLVRSIVVDGQWSTVDPGRVHELFYLDSDEAAVAAIAPRLRPMRLDAGAFLADSPARPVARTTYVICTEDKAIPPAMQRRMARQCDQVVEYPTDHSPFLTRPAELADLLASRL